MAGSEFLQLIFIGVIAGIVGQGLRIIVGLKKASDLAVASGSQLSKDFDVSRLFLSLFIGATAGCIGILTITGFNDSGFANIEVEMFFGVVGIGYAGTDFIEGFVRTKIPTYALKSKSSYTDISFQENESGNYLAASNSDKIKQSCSRLIRIPENASDCSKFVKSVAEEFSIKLTGTANEIFEQLVPDNGWTVLGEDESAGKRAAAAAAKGDFVIGARKENVNGHVVIVVQGSPLAHGKYPFAYWGKLNDPDNAGINNTVNWAWNQASRDSVKYASRSIT